MCLRQAEIQAAETHSILGTGESIANFDSDKFASLCADSTAKPVFNIMDPYFNFNITGTMSFEGIEFNGI